ncbi:DUF4124 domain-containing protein [Halomonas urumqiensis]|uniref:DUF4124 domain-containing protein n=1 Tax=Halomonas urumqiensis TaxID=1684789 RepID=A0A2N7UKG5_9GAMM|nr:DUF4124 domain-containing protein [Halomonas urumqiensis]PMR80924.1 DUF4124 domain-containing protein [Halomonas urumqiensis]PTB02882.1 DUF4124 domain-containing protein [Halomonas urumqiensis]GHE21405.1 hypothetical protein GCM10017767_19260 [Halomonas urumqiensis]
MRTSLMVLAVGLSLSLAAQAQQIFRSTDAQGNVVFTDNPEQGGEEVELTPLTVVPSRGEVRAESQPRVQSGASVTSSPGQPFMPYDSFRLLSPSHEQGIPVGQGGNVQVELGIEPELREDHRVRLLVDGQVSQSEMHTTVFMVANMNPGEHVLQAELLDATGEVRHRTSPVTIYVQRANVNRPSSSG